MIEFSGNGILLDVEGTTSSVAYVYDVLFPYARKYTKSYLEKNWNDPAVQHAVELIAQDAGSPEWIMPDSKYSNTLNKVCSEIYRLIDNDIKATGLKELQGLIWKEGYRSGKLKSHVFADVPIALENWHRAKIDIRIYSSGSVTAQKVFFSDTEYGDLCKFLNGHYDTTTGLKQSPDSYRKIANDMKLTPKEILFLSDVVAELDAAKDAGMYTALLVRPGNAPIVEGHGHPSIKDFCEILLIKLPTPKPVDG